MELQEEERAEAADRTDRNNGMCWRSAAKSAVLPAAGPAMAPPPAQSLPVAPATALAAAAATPLPKPAPAKPPARGAGALPEAAAWATAKPEAGPGEPADIDETAELVALLKQLSMATGRLADLLAKRL